jgi:hypothetical protein
MKNTIKKYALLVACASILSLQSAPRQTTEQALETITQQVAVITQNKGLDAVNKKSRLQARTKINNALATLKKEKTLEATATTLSNNVKNLYTACVQKSANTTNLENAIAENLRILIEQQLATVDVQQSYLSRLYSNAQNVFSRAAAPLYAGYHSTAEEKVIAQETINNLVARKNDLLSQEPLRAKDRQAIQNQIAQIDNEIRAQQIIIGEKWSTARRAAWGTVGAAGTAVAAGSAGLGYAKWKRLQAGVQSVRDFKAQQDQLRAQAAQAQAAKIAIQAQVQAESNILQNLKKEYHLDTINDIEAAIKNKEQNIAMQQAALENNPWANYSKSLEEQKQELDQLELLKIEKTNKP